MNDNQNNINNQETVNHSSVEAEVIGELRKEKIGRPELVIILFVLFGIVLVGLPLANKLLNDETSWLYKLMNPNDILLPDPVNPNKNEFADASVLQNLSSETNMKFGALVIKNFVLRETKLDVTMYSYTGEINLDKEEYYLEVYSSKEDFIAAVKLEGKYDNLEKNVTLSAKNLSFNSSLGYLGKVVKMEDALYPNIDVSSDESGLGSFTCKNKDRSIVYQFKNKYLIGIIDQERVKIADEKDQTEYLNKKKLFEKKAGLLNGNAFVEEVADGFKYSANINLENMLLPDEIDDSNYYPGDTEAKVIHYALQGKGFDCGE